MPSSNKSITEDATALPVQFELEQIAASPQFRKADRLVSLLRFVVEETLAGRGDTLKEYTLGVNVFGRPADYETKADPVVRLEMRRLRLKLAEYYQSQIQPGAVRIEIPKGAYLPMFKVLPVQAVAPTPDAPVPAARPRWAAVGTLVFAGLAVAGMFWKNPAAVPSGEVRLAVLPFEDAGSTPDSALADGFSDEVARRLSGEGKLRVAAHNSAFQFRPGSRQAAVSATEVGQRLGVQYLIRGRVAGSADHAAIDAWMIHCSDNAEIWRHHYEARELASLEQQVAVDVAARLVATGSSGPMIRREATRPDAHDLYLRGRYEWSKGGEESVLKSVDLLERAVARDPGYALAYAALADSYGLVAAWRIGPIQESQRKAEAAARTAIELDPGLAEGYGALGLIENTKWEWAAAEGHLKHALELNPGYSRAYQRLAYNYTVQRRFDEAKALLRTAQTLDPLQWFIEYNIGELNIFWRRYDAALDNARRIAEMEGHNASYYDLMFRIYLGRLRPPGGNQGRNADVERLCAEPGAKAKLICSWYPLDFKRRMAILDRTADTDSNLMISRSFVCIDARDHDCVFRALETAWDARDPNLVSISIEPMYDVVRKDPRYFSLMKRIGLRP